MGTSMKSSPELRPCLWDGLVALLVVVLAAACALAVWNRGNDAGELTAVVTVGGEETDRFVLSGTSGGDRTYSGNGYTLRFDKDNKKLDRFNIGVNAGTVIFF